MNFIKRKLHSDLTIRYERQIQRGKIRVEKREDTSKWSYVRWGFINVFNQFQHYWHFFILLIIWVSWIKFYENTQDGHVEALAIMLANLGISKELSAWAAITLPLFTFMIVVSVSMVVILKTDLDRVGKWRINLKLSNRFYIITSRRSISFAKVQRVFIKVVIGMLVVSCLSLIYLLGLSAYRTISENNNSTNIINEIQFN